jgi:hypothetical protein
VLALFAAGCGSGSSDTAGTTTSGSATTPTTASAPPSEPPLPRVDDTTAATDERPVAFGEACSNTQLPVADSYVVAGNTGLRARQLPGDGDIISVLPAGSALDKVDGPEACGVMPDGSVWWEIATPLLATGGWVHSSFLEPAGDEPNTNSDPADETSTDGTDDDRPAAFGEPCTEAQAPAVDTYVVVAESASSGRLVARQLPGPNMAPITALPNGSLVDVSADALDCAVVADQVWWNIGTPQLATGGWVNSANLMPSP